MNIGKPFIKWAGGKRWFVNNHSNLFPQQYNRYIEPFLGGGAVFFYLKPEKAILSDINSELIVTYGALQKDWEAVVKILKKHKKLHSNKYYYKIRSHNPFDNGQKYDEFQIAARFIYLNRTCFNGIYRVNSEGKFNVPIGTSSSIMYDTDDFECVSKILESARLFDDNFTKTISKSRNNDFIFADPPYTVSHNNNGFLQYNEKIFSWEDQIKLSESLARAKDRGVKIISTNANHPAVLDLYLKNDFKVDKVSRYSSISANPRNRRQYGEIIVQANLCD
ncbi:Dam family site-specific DNA-(adenine-N6)-methyltransferase [Methanolapillus millepedarum]|uniref:site-specific DNA-methyltransferase (adenine-specific) n=1 Tax=Methanolapillus millepedarum TaxID=3028296 RepID=A0AA96V3J5_9EURY|nr:Modification methylase DpnIIA [Methanosarcinaceae archaeon Ac7]